MTQLPSGATTAGPSTTAKPDVADASIGELIGGVTQDLSNLMRQEFELATAELKQEARKSGKVAAVLGGAGFAGYMVLLFLSIALWSALANVMDAGWSALIVAMLWAIAGAVLYATGRKQLSQVQPTPQRTVETLKHVPDALRGK